MRVFITSNKHKQEIAIMSVLGASAVLLIVWPTLVFIPVAIVVYGGPVFGLVYAIIAVVKNIRKKPKGWQKNLIVLAVIALLCSLVILWQMALIFIGIALSNCEGSCFTF
ncbi:hypothetical protein EOL96_06730 [Candidatus Saccharibacteria bacterium]|nr:hypothetical protein [Candidatus Saccharibacteria bacterium]